MRTVSSLCLLVASAGWMACSPEPTQGVIRLDGGAGSGAAGAPAAGTSGAAGTGGQTAGTSGMDPGTAGTGAGGDSTGTAGTGAGGDSTGAAGAGGSPTGTAGAGGGTAGTTGSAGTGAGGSSTGTAGTGGGTAGTTGAAGTGGGTAGTTGTAGGGGSTGAAGTGGAAGGENRIVLYDGTAATFNGWASTRNPNGPNPWRNNADGTMTVVTGSGDIQSKMRFQDLFVHVEYMTPVVQPSDTGATGQNRGNSGIYLKGSYEMQVLDSYGMPPAIDGCGAVYGMKAPSETACFMGGQWNTYEIEFKANVCNAQGQKTANARIVRATLNGKVVQQDFEVSRVTTAGQAESCNPAGLLLQDHSSFKPVIYRNIWVIPRN